MDRKLEKALEIYRKLGYEETDYEEIFALGIGDREEQRIAREGLKSGEWTEFRQLGKNAYGSVNIVGADLNKLAIFAVRVGVDVRRTLQVLYKSDDVTLRVIEERGEAFAQKFVEASSRQNRRLWEHEASVFGALCVHLVHKFRLPIPESVSYMKDWAFYAEKALKITPSRNKEKHLFHPTLEMIKSRLKEHIAVGISVNTPATGPFSKVLARGVRDGLLDKEEAREQVFTALDMALRPGDRKEWVLVLEEIGVSERDILNRAESLIPLLAHGETPITERFAPILIKSGAGDTFLEVLMNAFSAKSKKTRRMVLKSALQREQSDREDFIAARKQEYAEWLSYIRKTEDRTMQGLIDRLAAKWDIASEEVPMNIENEQSAGEMPDTGKIQGSGEIPDTEKMQSDGNTCDNKNLRDSGSASESEFSTGFWKKTPSLWHVPAFQCGEMNSENLVQLAAELSLRKVSVPDIKEEQFLAMANALAYRDVDEARRCLVGVKNQVMLSFVILGAWARNERTSTKIDFYEREFEGKKVTIYTDLISARNYVVSSHIEQLPCILSTPSFVDLSITFSDLVGRLLQYQNAGVNDVYEADLQLALTRLDVNSVIQADLDKIRQCPLRIVLPNGEILKDNKNKPIIVSQIVPAYLEDPYVEKKMDYKTLSLWDLKTVEMPGSLKSFPNRFNYNYGEFFSVFPLGGDVTLFCVRRDTEVYHGQGLILRQIARRRKSLGRAALMNLLAVPSYLSDENAEDVLTAIEEAWQRGLLVPKTADIGTLDWNVRKLSNLAALAGALDVVAEMGVLSVVWPVLDDLVAESLNAPRMLAGTAEIVKVAQKYLKHVCSAAEHGLAEPDALELKGIRRLAQKTGNSLAVTMAREMVEKADECLLLQGKQTETNLKKQDAILKKPEEINTVSLSFDEVWKIFPVSKPMIRDEIEMRIAALISNRSVKPFVFTLNIPGVLEYEYKVILEWIYSLESEGQVPALEVPKNSPDTEEYLSSNGKSVWLYWDEGKKNISVSPYRNREKKSGSPQDGKSHPIPFTFRCMGLALLAQDGEATYFAPALVKRWAMEGVLSQKTVKDAVQILLQADTVSPAKLVRILEKDSSLFSLLWAVLPECIQEAARRTAEDGKTPVWANRILDLCIYYSHILKEAQNRGFIAKDAFKRIGLVEIATGRAKSTARKKAEILLKLLNRQY